jgi:hypothetical protein
MPMYNVHVYGTCRVKVFNVNAANQHEATQKAYDAAVPEFNDLLSDCPGDDAPPMGDCEALFAGYADDITGYLVDEVGDTEHVNSRDYDAEGNPLPPIGTLEAAADLLRKLKEWHDFMGGFEADVWREVEKAIGVAQPVEAE